MARTRKDNYIRDYNPRDGCSSACMPFAILYLAAQSVFSGLIKMVAEDLVIAMAERLDNVLKALSTVHELS